MSTSHPLWRLPNDERHKQTPLIPAKREHLMRYLLILVLENRTFFGLLRANKTDTNRDKPLLAYSQRARRAPSNTHTHKHIQTARPSITILIIIIIIVLAFGRSIHRDFIVISQYIYNCKQSSQTQTYSSCSFTMKFVFFFFIFCC